MSTALAILPRPALAPRPTLTIVPRLQACAEPAETKAPPKPAPVRFAFYRKYTEAMLRQYLRFSMEAGRAPSLLGREMFRGKVTCYRVHAFDDSIIFAHDMEKCLNRLDHIQQYLILKIAIQQYTLEETAEMLHWGLSTVIRHYNKALDRLTKTLLEAKLLEPLKSCQEGKRSPKPVKPTEATS